MELHWAFRNLTGAASGSLGVQGVYRAISKAKRRPQECLKQCMVLSFPVHQQKDGTNDSVE